jgi:hypothetical protein
MFDLEFGKDFRRMQQADVEETSSLGRFFPFYATGFTVPGLRIEVPTLYIARIRINPTSAGLFQQFQAVFDDIPETAPI